MIHYQPLSDHEAHIRVEGRLDAHQAPELRSALGQLKEQGLRSFYLDVAGVEFMDSSGLAAVVSGLKHARTEGGDLYLIAPTEAVKQLLDYTMLDKVIPVFASLEAARS